MKVEFLLAGGLAGSIDNRPRRAAVDRNYAIVSLRYRMVYLHPNVNEEGRYADYKWPYLFVYFSTVSGKGTIY